MCIRDSYKHHGSVHKNQIKLKTEETTISATGTKVTVYLEYKDLEQYKEAFLRFVKPFSDTDIEKCWEQVLADDTRAVSYTHLDVYKRQLIISEISSVEI